tara:strand:- start:404 stop:817 length:414 start_codon:yes stop_codon:yes gene_type:complete
MDIRSFNKQKDYETLREWWGDWGLTKHHPDALSETGIIVSKDGVDICVGFIYSTDSYITWFEFITMNKKTTKQQREGALEKLFETMVEKAKAMSFKLIMCFGLEQQNRTSPILAKWRKENIGDVIVDNISQYYKIIN